MYIYFVEGKFFLQLTLNFSSQICLILLLSLSWFFSPTLYLPESQI